MVLQTLVFNQTWIAISGLVFICNGGVVSYKTSKKTTTTDSTTEAKYIAASDVTKEVVWIKKFVTVLGVVPSVESSIPLYCDNNGAFIQAKNPNLTKNPKT